MEGEAAGLVEPADLAQTAPGVNEATGDRTLANQKVESRIGCAILNQMIHLGKPDS